MMGQGHDPEGICLRECWHSQQSYQMTMSFSRVRLEHCLDLAEYLQRLLSAKALSQYPLEGIVAGDQHLSLRFVILENVITSDSHHKIVM